MGLKELGEKLDAAFSEAKERVEHVIHGERVDVDPFIATVREVLAPYNIPEGELNTIIVKLVSALP